MAWINSSFLIRYLEQKTTNNPKGFRRKRSACAFRHETYLRI
jgi:hypothetical protein